VLTRARRIIPAPAFRAIRPADPGTDQGRGPSRLTATSRLPVVLGMMSAAGALGLAIAEASGRQVDFDVYRMGAAHVLGQHLYEVHLAALPLYFTYPPFAGLLFWPFAELPVLAGQLAWSLLNVVMLAALTAISIRAARPQWSRQRTWVTTALALFPALQLSPDLLTLDFGQVNLLIALLVLLDLTCVIRMPPHTVPRGVLLGIAAAIKLTPLIFIPFLLATRQLRAGATALGTFLLCSLGAFAIAPRSSLLYWSTEIFNARRSGNLLYISDQNLSSALQRMMAVPPLPLLLDSLTLLAAVGGLAVATWAYRTSSPMLGMLLCAATGLIISPVSWSHHYVWIVPLLAWLALAPDRPRSGRWWALGAAALFWADPIWWVPNPQRGYGGPLVLLAGNAYFLAAVAFLLLASVLLWSRHQDLLRPLGPGRELNGGTVRHTPAEGTAPGQQVQPGVRESAAGRAIPQPTDAVSACGDPGPDCSFRR
jgi:alpha-1,2-mannosyltransferase